uniref:Uncharacterized protein LOC104223430 n=1 Tax=Nicotiana sylvestris TaxID=4096 RepID=A0A1U7WG09_NICSY|nr:PREDICTED: uncharacterized protein LOC104223430 [Nicotiana sylvestris]
MLPYLSNVHIDLLEIQIRERYGYCNAVEVEPNAQPWILLDHHGKRLLQFLPEMSSVSVVDFVHSNIICRFGIPTTIIMNNAANLNGHLMREICEQFKITHRNSTPYWPKANGAVEVSNKNIKKILRKMIQSSRQWNEKLPFALLGYRTTVRTSVGETPYLLVYGTKVVIPAKVEIPSLRIIVEAEVEDSDWVNTRLE